MPWLLRYMFFKITYQSEPLTNNVTKFDNFVPGHSPSLSNTDNVSWFLLLWVFKVGPTRNYLVILYATGSINTHLALVAKDLLFIFADGEGWGVTKMAIFNGLC